MPTRLDVDHVLRPMPPWRTGQRTECGREDTNRVITREDFLKRVKELGQQRAGLITCMTCFYTAHRQPDWATSPRAVIARDTSGWQQEETEIDRELRALEALYLAHQDEFHAIMATTTMDQLRARRRRR